MAEAVFKPRKPGSSRKPSSGPVSKDEAHMPSDVSSRVGVFDRFAERAAGFFSKAPFFAFCVGVVLIWAPSYFLLKSLDKWQLIINTATTIITFLMVALLQNSETRSDDAIQGKLNAIANALAELMEKSSSDELKEAVEELRAAVGIEQAESSS